MAGLPVVATSVGETPQVVVAGTGLLVPPHQPDDLAHAILSLLGDPVRAAEMGRAARDHAMRYYSAPVWFDKLPFAGLFLWGTGPGLTISIAVEMLMLAAGITLYILARKKKNPGNHAQG